ncbi:MAG: hypothetical protein J6C96_11125 [Oscillospiraceae bacterium]|nr:hypothetical protein [Oscillospiraceae bacterium]
MASKAAKTNKTDAVMRLLTGKKTASNPILDSGFKEEKITAREKKAHANGAEIDITSELVTELLPQVLKRFNCCACALCYADAMTEALDTIPTLRIKINGKEDLKRADKMKRESRKEVMLGLIRIAISRKQLPKHE